MRVFLFFILLSTGVKAQIVRCNPFYKPSAAATLFLDVYPSSTLAVSLRKLNSSYSGNCIRVRRSNDNAEQDIGFVNNAIDTASLKTFVSSANGFVTKWYDQSGNGNDLSQATAANQPQLVASGVVSRQSGKVIINFLINTRLFSASVLFNGATFSFITAIGSHTNASTDFFGCRNGATGWIYGYRTTPTYIFGMINSTTASISLAMQTKHIGFMTKTLTTSYLWVNSTNSNSIASAYFSTTSPLYVGYGGVAGGSNTIGYIFEVIGYTSDKGTSRTAMETNLNSYYSIY